MRRELLGLIKPRLAEVSNVTGYVGQVGSRYGLEPGAPADPPTKSDNDQRVKPYMVIFPGIGQAGDERALDNEDNDLEWTFTVRAVAADYDDLLALVDRIDAKLVGWRPGVFGEWPNKVLTGAVRHPVGYRPVVVTAPSVDPPRYSVSLQYNLTAHT